MNPLKHLRPSDARAIAKLATDATVAVTGIAEGVHQSVWGTLGVRGKGAGRTGGITGLVYGSVRGVTQLVAKGAEAALSRLEPLLEKGSKGASTPERDAVLAALNGVMGDRLAETKNPLATRMSLHHDGKAGSKIAVLVHGLCMNEQCWQAHTPAIEALGYSTVGVRYNTGLHTSQNGRELAAQLEQLLAKWPVAVKELTVIVHSMGGLVTRSALHYANEQGMAWPGKLKNIVFLGTPHHGAPLERAGNWVDVMLGATPYSAPFKKLTALRSAGITDLRYGHVLDEDWEGQDRFSRKADKRIPVPLPEGVACYTVAATTASKRSLLAQRLVGDGLVPLRSALGQHDDTARTLGFAKAAQCVVYGTNHMELLRSEEVGRQLGAWLRPGR
ncbi:MAG: alpha/beta hydrolase [Burkholderiales bacterium]|nr:alpha/beta hydrolase [Burkholderiales bacterium]